jgi:hypothetical protein
MTLSAMAFALILTAFQQPAYGEELVIAAGDEYATDQQEMGPQLAPVEADSLELDETAQFERLFGDEGPTGLSEADQAVVEKTHAIAWPWWSWPLGLFAIGALLIVRSRVQRQRVPIEAIHVVSRQHMGKDGTLALIEVQDGDSRKRRLLVGLGGGAPRLVADVSAWEVAVAAPSNIENQAVAIVGPDPHPDPHPELIEAVEDRRASLHVASFDGHLHQAAQRYSEEPQPVAPSKRDLIEEVMAQRDQVRLTSDCELGKERTIREARRKPTYSSREVVA